MPKRNVVWAWPAVCALSTLLGMMIGVVYEGPADWVAAALLSLPLALLGAMTRWGHR